MKSESHTRRAIMLRAAEFEASIAMTQVSDTIHVSHFIDIAGNVNATHTVYGLDESSDAEQEYDVLFDHVLHEYNKIRGL